MHRLYLLWWLMRRMYRCHTTSPICMYWCCTKSGMPYLYLFARLCCWSCMHVCRGVYVYIYMLYIYTYTCIHTYIYIYVVRTYTCLPLYIYMLFLCNAHHWFSLLCVGWVRQPSIVCNPVATMMGQLPQGIWDTPLICSESVFESWFCVTCPQQRFEVGNDIAYLYFTFMFAQIQFIGSTTSFEGWNWSANIQMAAGAAALAQWPNETLFACRTYCSSNCCSHVVAQDT